MSKQQSQPSPTFGRSRIGIALLFFLGIAGFLLLYEHRAHVLTGNGILIGLLVLCVGMHLFMHGGHGSHGSGHRHDAPTNRDED